MIIRLMVVQGKPKGKSLLFPDGEYVFGRGEECHVRPNSPWVSRQHCILNVSGDGCSIRDLGSTHGTLINGTRLSGERRLRLGDSLQIGPLTLEVIEVDPPTSDMRMVSAHAPESD